MYKHKNGQPKQTEAANMRWAQKAEDLGLIDEHMMWHWYYVVGQKKIDDIAVMMNCCGDTVRDRIRRSGIELRGRWGENRRPKVGHRTCTVHGCWKPVKPGNYFLCEGHFKGTKRDGVYGVEDLESQSVGDKVLDA